MVPKRRIKTARYIIGIAAAIIIFLFGFMASALINSQKFKQLSDMAQDIRADALSNELLYQLVQSSSCKDLNMSEYNLELYTIGKRLTYMESLYGFENQEVVKLKNYYSLLEIRHWMLMKEIGAKCGYKTPIVLYFYSNFGCADCEDQGLVLTNIHQEYGNLQVYSFEYALNNSALNYLKNKYNISQNRLPTLVINEEVHYGFQPKNKLIQLLELNS
ncbi:MAG: thioredoxin family protein [Candidatus Woesearchaeota archaeon]